MFRPICPSDNVYWDDYDDDDKDSNNFVDDDDGDGGDGHLLLDHFGKVMASMFMMVMMTMVAKTTATKLKLILILKVFDDLPLSSSSPAGPVWPGQGVQPNFHTCIWQTLQCKGPCKLYQFSSDAYCVLSTPGSFFQAPPKL